MINQIIEISKKEEQMKLANMNQEEIELHLILEKSRQEAEHDELIRKRNEELLKLMDNFNGQFPDD